MGEVDLRSPSVVAEAVVAWTGWGRAVWPDRDEARLSELLGAEAAKEVMPAVQLLVNDFYASDAHVWAANFLEMAEAASAQFRAKYPALPEEAVQALAWCYTFDHK